MAAVEPDAETLGPHLADKTSCSVNEAPEGSQQFAGPAAAEPWSRRVTEEVMS